MATKNVQQFSSVFYADFPQNGALCLRKIASKKLMLGKGEAKK